MPTYAVKQPNGKYALWSTVVDTFHEWNLTAEQVIKYELQSPRWSSYRGGHEKLRANLEEMIRLCDTNPDGKPWDWCEPFDELLWWMVYFSGMETERLAQMLHDQAITQEQHDNAIEKAQAEREAQEAESLRQAHSLLVANGLE